MSASQRVIVGLSGGVDSSVTALLLKEQRYQVEALFMYNWAEDEQGYCTAAEDFQSARRIAEQLEIPLHVADFSERYRHQVFDHFLTEIEAGRTPNPDLLCNRHIKFDAFLEHAKRLGANKIATGHYAQTRNGRLYRGVDLNKDQSYFLSLIQKQALQDCLFPIGAISKPEVRRLAEKAGLTTFDRPDSTGICFIGERPFADFVEDFLPPDCSARTAGKIVAVETSDVVGQHRGLFAYTLGQRRGLGIGGQANASESPWYVVDKDIHTQTLWVSQDREHPRLLNSGMTLSEMNWFRQPSNSEEITVQYRHRQKAVAATTQQAIDISTTSALDIRFSSPQAAVTPGQYAALYANNECLGAGVISQRHSLDSH